MSKSLIDVGNTAPDFQLSSMDNRAVSLAGVLTSHNAILYFVREYT